MVKSEKEGENTEGYIISNPQKKGAISEFFYHMLACGGFNLENGLIKVWGGPCFFIPLEAFVYLYSFCKRELGNEADEIFYWLGKLTGRNDTLVLLKKFGFNPKDLPNFINGATQDGLGYLELIKLNVQKQKVEGHIKGTNATFALKYEEIFGKQSKAIDFYLTGILSGGSEPLFNKYFQGVEMKCMGKGDDCCFYYLEGTDKLVAPKFFKDLSFKESDIIEGTKKIVLKRDSSFKILGSKDIKFGDGSFVFKGEVGINLMSYALLILHLILSRKLGKKKMQALYSEQSKIYVQTIIKNNVNSLNSLKVNIKSLNEIFSLFGYGDFEVKVISRNRIKLMNQFNPYAKDYVSLFGRNKESGDDFLIVLIKTFFERVYVKNKIEVKEIECISRGDRNCSFEVLII